MNTPIPSTPPTKLDVLQTHLAQELKQPNPLIGCRLDPTGRFAVAGAQDNSVQRWDLATGKATALAAHKSWVRALVFTADGKHLVVANQRLRVLSMPDGREIASLPGHSGRVSSIALSPDEQLLASVSEEEGAVRLWAMPALKQPDPE